MTTDAPQSVGELPLTEMESLAAELAWEAGQILARYFRSLGALNVEFKDERERDPVTNADTECQRLLVKAIAERFPDHGILGEEDEDREGESAPARDTVWVLDPLDGTRNFLNGLPIYSSSIGVMHKGVPVVGAVYVPWPGTDGMVVRARRGGGAFAGDESIGVFAESEPHAARLVTLPAYFSAAYSFRKPMRDRVGELRSLGSLAYDMVMVAMGVTQYSITTGPHLWDVAGGLAIASEAGAHIALGHRERRLMGLGQATRWERTESLVTPWRSGTTTMRELRRWVTPVAVGNPTILAKVTSNLRARPATVRRLRRWWRGRRRRGG